MVISILVTNLLNAIHYENVLVNESKDKSKIMNKSLKILFKTNIYPYSLKIQRAKSRILALKCLERSLMELKSKLPSFCLPAIFSITL